jgi:cardiolipin synthase
MIANMLSIGITAIIILNIFLAIVLIFLERRDASSTWAWLMVLFFIPVFGFVVYLLLGRQLRKKHLFRWAGRDKIGIDKLIDYQLEAIEEGTFEFKLDDALDYKDLINMHLRNNHAVLTQDNAVQIFNDGEAKFNALIEDLEQAKDHIHIQYYIFRLDIRSGL